MSSNLQDAFQSNLRIRSKGSLWVRKLADHERLHDGTRVARCVFTQLDQTVSL